MCWMVSSGFRPHPAYSNKDLLSFEIFLPSHLAWLSLDLWKYNMSCQEPSAEEIAYLMAARKQRKRKSPGPDIPLGACLQDWTHSVGPCLLKVLPPWNLTRNSQASIEHTDLCRLFQIQTTAPLWGQRCCIAAGVADKYTSLSFRSICSSSYTLTDSMAIQSPEVDFEGLGKALTIFWIVERKKCVSLGLCVCVYTCACAAM